MTSLKQNFCAIVGVVRAYLGLLAGSVVLDATALSGVLFMVVR